VPRLSGRRAAAERVTGRTVAVRAPQLYRPLRCFSLAAFGLLADDVAAGAEVPFAFEEHAAPGRPALYEYRPLVGGYVLARAEQLASLRDAAIAVQEVACEPAAAIFARAHCEAGVSEERALFRAIVLPLLVRTAEACGGFDWDDAAFDRAYGELEVSLFRDRRTYAAVAPLVGVSLAATVDLGSGIRIRRAAAGELAAHWPEAQGLLPQGFARELDRLCLLELERELDGRDVEPPDAPGELADAVTAVRLATAGALAAGPVLFERLDWRPLGIRPVLPIAATVPSGDAIRLDHVRGVLARDLLARLARADEDPELAEALDRWELSLFHNEPLRSEQLRASLSALLGCTDGPWAASIRAAVLLGENGSDRSALLARLRALAGAEEATPALADVLRRALVETLLHGDRVGLVQALDEALLGVRPRPAGYYAARTAALAS
jgi:hypothetical protein